MMNFRQFFRVVILAAMFKISTLECIRQHENYRVIYKCMNIINIEEMYNVIDSRNDQIHTIYVSNSNLSVLDSNPPYWTYVMELHFHHTNTSQIVPGFFKGLDNLQVLEITNNQLKVIIDGVFSSFQSLEKLNLSSNLIETLTSHSFSGLSMLKVLDLSKNEISRVSNDVFKYQNSLEQVNLSENILKDIGNTFSRNNVLQNIDLSKNNLIDFDFSQLKNKNMLNVVDLSKNLLENITIPNFINLLGRVSNHASPDSRKLSIVNISYNSLKRLDENISNLSVHILDFSHNKISHISRFSFKNSSSLEYLHLQYNNIKVIQIETFNNLTKLTHLDMSFNAITEIPFGLFNNLNQLIYLDLAGNNMILNFDTLTTLKSLKVLKLQNNTVQNFNPDILIKRFKYLTFVSLGNDLWNCSELANTVHLLQTNNVSIGNGNAVNTSNILGISCVHQNELREEDVTFERNTEINLKDDRNKDMSMQKFLNEDFKNTEFYKFFKNFGQYFSVYNKSYVNNEATLNPLIQYLNDNFTNTNFYKFLENIKDAENKNSETYSQLQNILKNYSSKPILDKFTNKITDNFTFINVGNVSQSIEKLLFTLKQVVDDNKKSLIVQNQIDENLKTFLDIQNISSNKLLEFLEKIKPMEKYEQQALVGESFKSDHKSLRVSNVITNVLLILIFFSVIYCILVFLKPRRMPSVSNEQVQLM